mmetsp:Transcript_3552/g.2772  ORF Transcript_3552/g.2772 Transcript_3552/m.2772 type:complete len:80 (-) Transcript_3552:26-265(-)
MAVRAVSTKFGQVVGQSTGMYMDTITADEVTSLMFSEAQLVEEKEILLRKRMSQMAVCLVLRMLSRKLVMRTPFCFSGH